MSLFLSLILFFSLNAVVSTNNIINQNVIICGVCRDVGDRLPYTIQIMESLGSRFKDYKVIVYENNSKDQTKDILKSWVASNSRVQAISEDVDPAVLNSLIINYKENKYFRPEEISRARNIVLDVAMSNGYANYPYIIWLDMDFKIPPVLDGLYELFRGNREWDAVFAYGIDPPGSYWDWYAFRDAETPLGSESLGNLWWHLPKTFKLSKKSNWYPVTSAFGGFGIYKKSSIVGCRYSAVVTKDLETLVKKIIKNQKNDCVKLYYDLLKKTKSYLKIPQPLVGLPAISDPDIGILISDDKDAPVFRMSSFVYQYPSVCEHVPFHATMILNGHDKLYINPRIIFNYGG